MNKFLIQSFYFLLLVLALACLSPFLPAVDEDSNMVFALEDKHEIISKMPSPKIILLGGSNISFGTNSKRLMDSLGQPTFDLGIHAGLGLKFMMDDVRPYIKEGDLVVLIPEYGQFIEDAYYGNDEVIQFLFDGSADARKDINFQQVKHLFPKIPAYIGGKYYAYFSQILSIKETKKDTTRQVYHRNAFDAYGDHVAHLGLPNESFSPDALYGTPCSAAFEGIYAFNNYVKSKKARLVLSYPSYQEQSFRNSEVFISKMDSTFHKDGIVPVISSPKRYAFADSLCFNTYYHLNKEGRELRTGYLIEDLKGFLRK